VFYRNSTKLMLITLSASISISCSSFGSGDPHKIAILPQGPGGQFSTIEDAAIDGLAHAFLLARSDGNPERMYGGSIRISNRGYTYDAINAANRNTPVVLHSTLDNRDVARFHIYPRIRFAQDHRLNERISRADRRSVDRSDPNHRPLFVLTPRLSVLVYRGNRAPISKVASLRPLSIKQQLAER
jgi:hypothetical protein